jgi:hypothetical protein
MAVTELPMLMELEVSTAPAAVPPKHPAAPAAQTLKGWICTSAAFCADGLVPAAVMLTPLALVGIALVSVNAASLQPVTVAPGLQGSAPNSDCESVTPVTTSEVLTPLTTYVTVYDEAPGAQEIVEVGLAGGVVDAVPVTGEVRTRAMAVLVRQVPPEEVPQPLAPLAAKLLIV